MAFPLFYDMNDNPAYTGSIATLPDNSDKAYEIVGFCDNSGELLIAELSDETDKNGNFVQIQGISPKAVDCRLLTIIAA